MTNELILPEVKCSNCDSFNSMSNDFCNDCGIVLVDDRRKYCPKCHTEFGNRIKKCKNCKTKMDKQYLKIRQFLVKGSGSNQSTVFNEEKQNFLERFSRKLKDNNITTNPEHITRIIENKMKYYPTVRLLLSKDTPEFLIFKYNLEEKTSLKEILAFILNNFTRIVEYQEIHSIRSIIPLYDLVPSIFALLWKEKVRDPEMEEYFSQIISSTSLLIELITMIFDTLITIHGLPKELIQSTLQFLHNLDDDNQLITSLSSVLGIDYSKMRVYGNRDEMSRNAINYVHTRYTQEEIKMALEVNKILQQMKKENQPPSW